MFWISIVIKLVSLHCICHLMLSFVYCSYYSVPDTYTLQIKTIFKQHVVFRCFFDLRIGSLPKLFRVDIELYTDIVPGTAGNFVSLCRGFEGLSYKGSVLHRIVPGLMCVGGDIVNRSGTGGISIYGQYFSDENFLLQHNGPGRVSDRCFEVYKTVV